VCRKLVESRLVGNLLSPTWEFANFLKTSLTVPDVSQQAPEMGKKMKLFSFKKQRLQTAIVLNQQRHLQDHELNVIIDPAIDAAETTESFFTNSSDPASFSTTLESESSVSRKTEGHWPGSMGGLRFAHKHTVRRAVRMVVITTWEFLSHMGEIRESSVR
jgi:hypothetical protein